MESAPRCGKVEMPLLPARCQAAGKPAGSSCPPTACDDYLPFNGLEIALRSRRWHGCSARLAAPAAPSGQHGVAPELRAERAIL